jgi:hypothetical protein
MSWPVEWPKPHSAPSADAAARLRPIVSGVSACFVCRVCELVVLRQNICCYAKGENAKHNKYTHVPQTHRQVVGAAQRVQEPGGEAGPPALGGLLRSCLFGFALL